MFRLVFQSAARLVSSRNPLAGTQKKFYSIYEPDYLDALKPKFPRYECLNFRITGYDFAMLESYQKFLHSVAEYFELDVSDCYALPPKHELIQRFKPNTSAMDAEYKLTSYERTLRISNLDAPKYPFFLRIAQAAIPQGVTLNILEHTPDQEEVRYVPDKDLLELKTQLEMLQSGKPQAKKTR